jgi:hypothetical protein
MKLSLPTKLVEKLVWVPVICFCKIFIPNCMFDALICRNWQFSPPNRVTSQIGNTNCLIFSTCAAVLFLLKLSSPSRHCASVASELATLASGGDKGRTPQLQKMK